MFETNQFNLPLLQASQSQKHVTVNEAIARLDALAQLRFMSVTKTLPDTDLVDGACYSVPDGASGDWVGNDGKIAIFSNGGWVYLTPKIGWKAWVVDQGAEVFFSDDGWVSVEASNTFDPVSMGVWGSKTEMRVIEHEHVIVPGASNDTPNIIPENAYIMAVMTRNSEEIVTDGATSWKLGLSWDNDRYGDNRNLGLNETNSSNIAQRVFYYRTANKLTLTPENGSFVSGKVRISLHCTVFTGPDAV